MECYYDYYLSMCVCEQQIVHYDVSYMITFAISYFYEKIKK